ncbi:MAG TPA: hypothetical protein VKB78_10350, partial [Pirellulales bacterium]|nr:hypothetical protein [Pirellulales bacterium]
MTAARRIPKVALGLFASILPLGTQRAAVGREPGVPPHLAAAFDLVEAIKPSDTNYQHHDNVVHFPVDGGSKKAECRTDCSGLLDAVLKRAYGLSSAQLSDWLDAKRPLAKHYHSTILAERGFKRVSTLPEVRPGDILAIDYPAGSKGNNTGHVMIVAGMPRERKASEPVVGNTL